MQLQASHSKVDRHHLGILSVADGQEAVPNGAVYGKNHAILVSSSNNIKVCGDRL